MTVETTAARRQRLGLKCVTVELDEEFHLLLRKIAGKQLWTQRAAIEESIRLMAKRLKLLEE